MTRSLRHSGAWLALPMALLLTAVPRSSSAQANAQAPERTPASAQERTPAPVTERALDPDTRVRITTVASSPYGRRFTGRVVSIDAAAVTVAPDDGGVPFAVPRSTLSRLERSAGRHSRWRGAALGALVGFGVGAIVGRLSTHCGASDWICLEGVAVLGGGLMGAGGGAAVGAALPPRERWVLVVRLDR